MPQSVIPFIFASGHGTRLRPLTNSTPKPLIPVHGEQTIIDLTLNELVQHGSTQAFVNYSYGKKDFLALKKRRASTIELTLVDDESVCGQGGILLKELKALSQSDYVLCINGDTVISFDLDTFAADPQSSEVRLLSDNSYPVEQNLLCDASGKLYGRGTAATEPDVDWYLPSTPNLTSHNYLGVALFPTEALQATTMTGEFMGFFGSGELVPQLIENGTSVAIKSVTIDLYQTANTLEELTALRAALQ